MKTIELIDKYEVHQSKEGDYNPPSYIWIDNTGELIRCKDCKYRNEFGRCNLFKQFNPHVLGNGYCSDAKRKEE